MKFENLGREEIGVAKTLVEDSLRQVLSEKQQAVQLQELYQKRINSIQKEVLSFSETFSVAGEDSEKDSTLFSR